VKSDSPILIAVAWPYVNGVPHVGHFAGALLPADIVARYFRLRGHRVLMVSGSDCFGTPITVEADKCGKSPRDVANHYHPLWQARFERLRMSYDLYTTTLTENHKQVVQDIFVTLLNKGLIDKGSSRQYYSEVDNRFLPDRYVEGTCPKCGYTECRSDQCDRCGAVIPEGELLHPVSKISGGPAELRETEHYFLQYQKLQPFLEEYVESSSHGWRKWIRAETLKWLNEGLKPRAITRDLDWGIEIPVQSISADALIDKVNSKRLYVWFDAVIGYLSASIEWANGSDDWTTFWKNGNATHYYFMGKDNLVFHTLFWPSYLHSYDEQLHLPDVPAINQYLTFEGEKFSKSRGVLADPSELADKYSLDGLRFYLATIMPETSDSDFTVAGIKDAVNGKLIAKIGNFINRSATLAAGQDFSAFSPSTNIVDALTLAHSDCQSLMKDVQIRRYTERLLTLAEFANSYITERAPWSLRKEGSDSYSPEKFKQVMGDCILLSLSLLTIGSPIFVDAIDRFRELSGIDINSWPDEIASHLTALTRSWKFDGKPTPLFSRIEDVATHP
jgi:methionyl-tRNA synthetase